MANVAKSRKEDITRTERKEAKGVIQAIRKKNASLRRLVAELRTRVFLLERENKRLKTTIREFQMGFIQKTKGKPNKAR